MEEKTSKKDDWPKKSILSQANFFAWDEIDFLTNYFVHTEGRDIRFIFGHRKDMKDTLLETSLHTQ